MHTHLCLINSASLMSAPSALAMSKILYPETEEPLTKGTIKAKFPVTDVNGMALDTSLSVDSE